MKKLNNYKKFFEANLRDNKGLDKDYINNIKQDEERNAHRKMRSGEVNPREIPQMVEEIMRLQGGEIEMGPNGASHKWNDLELKSRIEELAFNIIKDKYGRVIDALNIEMDIKLIDPDELNDMKNGDEMEDQEQPPENEESDDEDFRNDVDKRKIANVITQGSAKNVHRLIHLYKEKIEEFNPRLFGLMDKLIKSMETMEWLMPEDKNQPGAMIRQGMNGFAKVEWEDEDEDETEEKMKDIDIDKILNGDDEEESKMEEEFEGFNGKIKVKARAIDLVVLLHESVKGIYEVLGSPSLPEFDSTRAEDIMLNTDTLDDEFEDLRYGPKIREDLLNFVNSNEKINQIDDGFEYVWGELISMESGSFLELFKDIIIIKSDKSKKWLDQVLDKLIEEDKQLKNDQADYDRNQQNNDFQEKIGSEEENHSNEIDRLVQNNNDTEEVKEDDYENMSQSDLQDILDDALDNEDYQLANKVSHFIK